MNARIEEQETVNWKLIPPFITPKMTFKIIFAPHINFDLP